MQPLLWKFLINEVTGRNVYFKRKELEKTILTQKVEVDPVTFKSEPCTNSETKMRTNNATNSNHIPSNQLSDMLVVPINFEKLMYLAILTCIDAILYDLTFMPIQAIGLIIKFASKHLKTIIKLIIKKLKQSRKSVCKSNQGDCTLESTFLKFEGTPNVPSTVPSFDKYLHKQHGSKIHNNIQESNDFSNRSLASNFVSEGKSVQNLFNSALHNNQKCLEEHKMIPFPAFSDLIRCSLLAFSILFFSRIDMSRLYHYIRAQPFMKLYVIFNMLEIFERLCRSIGKDMIDSLITAFLFPIQHSNPEPSSNTTGYIEQSSTARNIKNIFLNFNLLNSKPEPTLNLDHFSDDSMPISLENTYINGDKIFNTIKLLLHYLAVLLYILLHSFMHLIRVLSLSIAINSSESIMFIIVVTNNFGEIKSTVFKKYTDKTLFQIVSSDIVERFLLFCDGLIVFLRISTSRGFHFSSYMETFTWLLFVFILELLVDWVKHSFIIKFNHIRANAFLQFKKILMGDIIFSRLSCSYKTLANHHFNVPFKSVYSYSHIASRRIGFMALPVVTLIVCCIPKATWNSPLVLFSALLFWLLLLLLKLLTSILLLAFSVSRHTEILTLDSSFNYITAL